MATFIIPEKVKAEAKRIIDEYNNSAFDDWKSELFYYAQFKGAFLYLIREEFGKTSPIARLKYTGDIKCWEFAIYKWSNDSFDPEEDSFPGYALVDGTILGAMKTGMEAYPL